MAGMIIEKKAVRKSAIVITVGKIKRARNDSTLKDLTLIVIVLPPLEIIIKQNNHLKHILFLHSEQDNKKVKRVYKK
jgi:hypothetical protein